MVYNSDTIESASDLTWDPPESSGWQIFCHQWNVFWGSKFGKGLALGLFVAATVLAFACPAFMPVYLNTVVGISATLAVGGAIAGFRNLLNGGKFWEGFTRYINENWAQEVAIGMAIAMVAFGISQAAQAIANSGVCNGTECFIAGTLVLCKDENGNECHKPIEEIEVGDSVWAYAKKQSK